MTKPIKNPPLIEPPIEDLLANDSVYSRNAYAAKLNALKATFPVTATFLGEQYFTQCANTYIESQVMSQQDLNLYGQNFHETMQSLVEQKEELKEHDYLPELVLFEWMLHYTYYHDNGENIYRMIAHYNVKDLWEAHQAEDIDAALEQFQLIEGEFRYQFN